VEEVDIIWGVPKIVWVLLANTLALAAWAMCIGGVLFCARQPPEKSQQEIINEQAVSAAAAQYRGQPDSYRAATPSFTEPYYSRGSMPSYSRSQTPTFMGANNIQVQQNF